jgi:hypothetical protein
MRHYRAILYLLSVSICAVEIGLDDGSFAFYDTASQSWKIEPGAFEILVGAPSCAIKLKGLLEISK